MNYEYSDEQEPIIGFWEQAATGLIILVILALFEVVDFYKRLSEKYKKQFRA